MAKGASAPTLEDSMATPNKTAKSRINRWFSASLLAAIIPLSGCIEQSRADLEEFVEDVMSRSSTKIEPLPPIRPYELYSYSAGGANKKDPFQTFFEKEGDVPEVFENCTPGVDVNCIAPDPDRNKEELEFYPLDSLRMVGTLEQEDTMWGVVLSAEGTVHRVTIDNYIGQNHGRIINIREEGIELLEIVSNGTGGWLERPTKIALAE
jgi:type IV pilus assembly protein PilP